MTAQVIAMPKPDGMDERLARNIIDRIAAGQYHVGRLHALHIRYATSDEPDAVLYTRSDDDYGRAIGLEVRVPKQFAIDAVVATIAKEKAAVADLIRQLILYGSETQAKIDALHLPPLTDQAESTADE